MSEAKSAANLTTHHPACRFAHAGYLLVFFGQMTRVIVEVARLLGIAVHDYIIVGKESHARLKGLKLI